MKNEKMKIYEIPQVDLLSFSAEDILTLSEGFDGMEDDFTAW